ncbi:MAG: inositol monophosphatase, partial [Gammaproteobacteria bacterium TMED225]
GIYIWDIAAGIAIVESAGGKTEVLNYKDNFQVDIVLSNSKI